MHLCPVGLGNLSPPSRGVPCFAAQVQATVAQCRLPDRHGLVFAFDVDPNPDLACGSPFGSTLIVDLLNLHVQLPTDRVPFSH